MRKNLYFLREQHLQFLKSYIRILLFADIHRFFHVYNCLKRELSSLYFVHMMYFRTYLDIATSKIIRYFL